MFILLEGEWGDEEYVVGEWGTPEEAEEAAKDLSRTSWRIIEGQVVKSFTLPEDDEEDNEDNED